MERATKARNINNSDFRFDVINIGRQVLGNLFSEYRDQFTACYNRKDTTGMREWSTRMDNLLLDVDHLLSCDATLSIGKWLQDARNCGATVSEKDYYEENARCILTVWGQQDTQLNDYANRGWGRTYPKLLPGTLETFHRRSHRCCFGR